MNGAQTRALWGDVFEVAVKRGCLAVLQERGLLKQSVEHVRPWRELRVADLHRCLYQQTDAVDPRERAGLRSSADHLLVTGWGLGWTVMRECLHRLGGEQLHVLGVYCPLSLPDRRQALAPDPERRAASLWQALALRGAPDPAWTARGEPANADMLVLARVRERYHLICLEFSLHAPPEAEDYTEEMAHLAELERYVQHTESRGVFTRISAEVTGEHFAFSDAVISHLSALTTPDKPLYKLCQGSSYATRLLHLLERRGHGLSPATAHVIAVTNAGIEALRASFGEGQDPRAQLMAALGEAYRRVSRLPEGDEPALDREIQAVRGQICRSLPAALRDQFEETFAAPPSSRHLSVRLREQVEGFVNPAAEMPRSSALRWVEDAPRDVEALLGGPARDRVAAHLEALRGPTSNVSLRDIHAAALLAGLSAARPGGVTVLAAEGHPGIGKTTAILEYLRRRDSTEGFLFFYASPRTVINGEVTRKVARDDQGRPTGVLTLTTNSRLIRGVGARNGGERLAAGGGRGRYVDAAVIADGVADLVLPEGSTEFLTPDEGQMLDEDYASSGFRKRTWDERLDVVETRRAPGVLVTLARAARACLGENPSLNRVVITAAIQGYRLADGGASTVDRLSELFRNASDTPHGLRERRTFAERVPTIVVMVDEIAGDGAGAPFVHALAAWLDREFMQPFAGTGQVSPFRVVLVLSDASLGNDAVLASYLANNAGAPEKVLVSESAGPRPFRLTGGGLTLGGRALPVLHVMADGFPAKSLEMEYHLRLKLVHRLEASGDGPTLNLRKAIREQHGEAQLRAAVEEVFEALSRLPAGEQVILFAQDKGFLRDLRRTLVDPSALQDRGEHVETHGQQLTVDEIGLLDSSIAERERRRLTDPAVRDAKRVILMTSSGSRGVSFPHATTLIALVPTFAVESGFMEIAQLIYRGRGTARNTATGEQWDGDALDRRIVLLLQDFVAAEEQVDNRQWLRRTLDLVSALVLLRATVLTRITGDAGIPGQRAAVVPVGRIGGDETETSLAQSVDAFLHEAAVFLRDASDIRHRLRVDRAVRDAEETFRELRLVGTAPDPARRSMATPAVMRRVMDLACAAATPLLGDDHGAAIPDVTYGLGPIWLESWTDMRSEESFRFQGAYTSWQQRLRRLLATCRAIEGERDLPGTLRRTARDIVDIVQRNDEGLAMTFVTRRVLGSHRVWVCLPVDYERFCTMPPGEEHTGERFRLAEAERWLEALRRTAGASTALAARYPVLPYYDGRPFLVMTAYGDPTGFERTFDDRYFMASSELNLLNTLLFVGE
jgi:hypothetical protein